MTSGIHPSLVGQQARCLQLLLLVTLAACLLSKVDSQAPVSPPVLPYISLGSTAGVQREYVGHFDDGVSNAIHIPGGFPFGNLIHSFAFVGTNGIFAFSEPFYAPLARPFPGGAPGAYIVAPYWDDVDIRLAGNISYEVHSRSANNPGSNRLLDEVSDFVEDSTGQSFEGSWMLVAEWREVHPWPHGVGNPIIWTIFFPELVRNNTWQGLVITDGTESYAVFIYRCGDMTWAYNPTIGFTAAGSSFANHPNTGSTNAEEIACLNTPLSQWYNLVYQISLPNATNQTSLPTIEPPQSSYLLILELTNSTATSGTLPPCQNCTAAVAAPGSGFPFGAYYHSTIYVGTNGIFSFGQDFHLDSPEPFPSSTNALVDYAYLVAPYWSNVDTRLEGHVTYEVHVTGESSTSDDYLRRVSSLINSEEDDPGFIGSWMIMATWDNVHPFPHGSSPEQDRVDPYLQSTNTFQGILITNGTQSYSVFTYECDQMEWSDEATIGYNAGVEYHKTHPLSGTLTANAVDCLHSDINVTVNNIIFNLVPSSLNEGSPPSPPSSLGSCVDAGFSRCCESGSISSCLGANPSDCYCDEYCHRLGDCCVDITDICQVEEPTGNGSYLLFGSLQLLSRVSLTGSDLHVLVHQPNSAILGVDFDFRRGYLYWSEGIGDAMYRSAMDGSNIETLLNTSTEVVDDIAVDWVGNNLYWTDAFYARIEVMDLDTRHRRELMRTGNNTIPRAIAVDPSTRYMYWTDWGGVAKIERASMDGSDRRVLHSTGLTWPNGLTIDYPAQRIYWVDASLDRIEYSNVDGSGRFILFSGLDHPFAITLEGNLLFWTDWLNNAIHIAHKISGAIGGNLTLFDNLRDRPFGIEAVSPIRQAQNVANPCDGASCVFMCLLSATSADGFSCACPDGYELSSDGTNCTFVSAPLPPNTPGSCIAAEYHSCCTSGYCQGSPPNCACDVNCYQRGDCCGDINMTCPTGSCAAAGYRACCTDGGDCLGTEGCYCDSVCIFFGDCCHDFEDLCPTIFGSEIGSCAASGYTECCTDGSDCLGAPANCKCDTECRDHGDCCADIASTCPLTTIPGVNVTLPMSWLPFLTLRVTPGVDTLTVPALDDGSSFAISIPTGFPIGNSNQSIAYIGTNGVISFQQPFTHHEPSLFPSDLTFISSAFLLAPFWSDIDISVYGSIFYEVHREADSSLITQVNHFISNHTESNFTGTWMLVAQWDLVREYPGLFSLLTNTFQAIAITDGSQSYAVYTYRCGDLGWSGGATIGYNGGPVGNFYANHPLSGTTSANAIACLNSGLTEWSNLVYNISIGVYIPTEPPPTLEPPQSVYLEFLERTSSSLTLRSCDDCVSPAITLGSNPVPFGDLYHSVAHVSSNGIISFGSGFPNFGATLFPNPNNPIVFNSYIAAPYWSDIDGRTFGEVWYETHVAGQSATADSMLERVSNLVRSEQNLSSFQGTWMVVATWNGSVPFAGNDVLRNTFQGIVITDGSKTYAVYTYHCDDVQWSDGSVIGFNAGGSYYANHPLSDSIAARDIDCVHRPGSEWNNVVYDLNPNGTTIYGPPVLSGSCVLAGYTECCNNSVCLGQPVEDCYCDPTCHVFGDCCEDINATCPAAVIHPSEISLLVAESFGVLRLSINGSTPVALTQLDPTAFYIGLDYDYRNNLVYYSDIGFQVTVVGRVPIDGSAPSQDLLVVQYGAVEDLAVDWIANNLYWTDGYYNRLEALDLDTLYRTELLQTGPHTAPRAIVVDPNTRYMYWTDWGEPGKIERASMDGSNRTVLHDTELIRPNGLAIDYQLQRLYWADAFTDRIEYSSVDGTGREILLTVDTGLHHPFAITISGDQVYWTDRENFTVYTAHKLSPISILPVYNTIFLPNGIEAVDSNRQQENITNYCEGSPCSHLCLLSATSPTNYTCACPEGSSLMPDGLTCTQITNITVSPPTPGSCAAAGYSGAGCCTGGYCAGSPPNCFCEPDCVNFRDCCDDFNSVCLNPVTSLPTSQPTTPSPSLPPTSHFTSQPTGPPQTIPSLPPTSHSTSQPTSTPQTSPFQPTSRPETTHSVPPTTTQQPTTTMQPVPPGPVLSLSAFSPESSDSILIVTWLPPSIEPSDVVEILYYNVSVTNYSMTPVANMIVSTDQTSTIVDGLGPFIPYFVSVAAVSAVGEGIATSVLNFTQQGAPPVSPSNVKVDKMGSKMSVSWDPLTPEQAWGFVTSYTIAYAKESGSQKRQILEKTVPGTENSTVIEGLDPNQDYSVSIRADTKAGGGKVSEPTSSKAPGSTDASRGNNGGAIAGGLIAVIVALVVLVLVVLVAIYLIKRRARMKTNSYTMFDDSLSLSSSTSEDIRPRMNTYQQTGMFKKKMKKEELVFNEDNSNGSMDTYNPVDARPSFENPLYASNPALDPTNPTGAIDCIDNPVYEDVKDVKLDQYEVPKLKNENPYEFS